MLEPDPPPDSVAETREVVLGELGRMERIVDRLLLVERALSPEFLRLVPTPAAQFVTEIFRRWPATADRRWVLDAVAPGTAPIDVDQLTLALDLMIENAVAHTGVGDTIAVGSRSVDGRLVVRIRDTGNGIAPDVLPHIFERFFRGDRGRSRRTGGAGLGLSVSRAVVRAHGGDITVASAPGSGATFEVSLPGFCEREPVSGAADRFDRDGRRELAPQPSDADVHHV